MRNLISGRVSRGAPACALVIALATALTPSARGQGFKVLYAFPGDFNLIGGGSEANLRLRAGNLYGASYLGGSSGAGTIFVIAP